MIRTFARLKLRLLINGVKRSKNKFTLILSIMVALAALCISIVGLIVLRNADDAWFPPVVISALAILMVAWLVLPLLVGMTDGTVDPSRLAHLPIRRHQLIAGLLASTLIGIMPICIGLVLLGLVMFANSVGSAAVIVVAAFLALLLGSVLAQIGSASLSGLLRGRRTRDVAGAVLGFLAIGGATTSSCISWRALPESCAGARAAGSARRSSGVSRASGSARSPRCWPPRSPSSVLGRCGGCCSID